MFTIAFLDGIQSNRIKVSSVKLKFILYYSHQNTLPVHIKLMTLQTIKNKLHERFGENYITFKEMFSKKSFSDHLGSEYGKYFIVKIKPC